MDKLFSTNTPQKFWNFTEELPNIVWSKAIEQALPLLGLAFEPSNMDELLMLVLGEGQFGSEHWKLSSLKNLYYDLKPWLPRPVTRAMRQLYQPVSKRKFPLGWPAEERYALFLWEICKQVLTIAGKSKLPFLPFWPKGNRFAFVLTHDIETGYGQSFVRKVADLEESLGFRSSFNFVPERYPLDQSIINELKERGFEVGIHGLKHDGKLFRSRSEFDRRAKAINQYIKSFDAAGFRAPLTHRHPEWMQALDIEYDLSFFDTDPYEPISGGTMSLWPFFMGHFVELPYTLVQDYTLTSVLGETSPKIWIEKVGLIKKYHGMALINSHPDYLTKKSTWDVYCEFLTTMKKDSCYWHALPQETARWWRNRAAHEFLSEKNDHGLATASIQNGELVIDIANKETPTTA